MYRAGRYGEPDAALCPGPENDDFADAFYELFCKAADLCVFHSGVFPETRGICDDCTVFWRNCDRDFDGTFHAWDAVSGEAVPFVMELPNYRMPGAKNVGHLLWDKAKDFLQRAFTVIFMATLVIWFLQTFDLHLNIAADSKDSILALAAEALHFCLHPWALETGGSPRR